MNLSDHIETIEEIVKEAQLALSYGHLPSHTGETLKLLSDNMPTVPLETLLIDLNVKLSQAYSINRPMAGDTLVNYYGMIFMPSGMGKDYPISFIDSYLMHPFKDAFKERAESYFEDRLLDVRDEALERYKDTKNAEYRAYIQNNQPRYLIPEIGDATPEGFYDYRLELDRAGFGGAFIKVSEFGDYLSSSGEFNNSRAQFLSDIIEAYEDGSSNPKMIKLEKKQEPIKGVPINALFHTSLSNFSDRDKEKLMKYLNRGGARRFFVAFVDKMETELTPEQIYEQLLNQQDPVQVFDKFRLRLSATIAKGNFKRLIDDEGLLAAYQVYNMTRENKSEGDRATLTSLHRKAQKLAGIIAITENPGGGVVSQADVIMAIYQCEVYYKHFLQFYRDQTKSEVARLYEYLLTGAKTLTEIRSLKLVPQRQFTVWFQHIIPELREYSAISGRVLREIDHGAIGKKYSIETLI